MGGPLVGCVLGIVTMAVFTPRPAGALCVCADFEGCSSALNCEGRSPGDSCSPPRNGTCKIVKGNGNGVSCCCGCTRGPGPISCVYGAVIEELRSLEGVACAAVAAGVPAAESCACVDRKLAKRARGTAKGAGGKLRAAERGCAKGKDPRKKVGAAKRQLESFDARIERLLARDKITPECADALQALIADLGVAVDTAAAGGGGGATTTTAPSGTTTSTTASGGTTTTTIPDTTCTGWLDIPPGFPNERNFTFSCAGPGGLAFSGFRLTSPDAFQFVNWIDPPGFNCQILPMIPGGTFSCAGMFAPGDTVAGGRVAIAPPPPGGLLLDLHVLNGMVAGPFPLATAPPF